MPNTSNGNAGAIFPTWTTATRSSTAQSGEVGYNITTGFLEIYNGTTKKWSAVIQIGNAGAIFPTWTTATRSATAQSGEVGYNTTTGFLEIYYGTTKNWSTIIQTGNAGAIFPTWTAATRSATAQTGETGYNTNTNTLETFNGTLWVAYIPPGTVISYAGITPPNGYLVCNGSTISRTVYTGLFGAIGATFGAGDGSTTFAIPDYRGAFVRGYDGTGTRYSGSVFGTYESDSFASHAHTQNYVVNLSGYGGGGSAGGADPNAEYCYNTYYGGVNTSYNGGAETKPKNIPILYIIKY